MEIRMIYSGNFIRCLITETASSLSITEAEALLHINPFISLAGIKRALIPKRSRAPIITEKSVSTKITDPAKKVMKGKSDSSVIIMAREPLMKKLPYRKLNIRVITQRRESAKA